MWHDHNHSHHNADDKNWLIISIFLNSFIVIWEFIWWIVSGSLALLSDAIHNLSDVLSLIFSYFWEKISKKKWDKNHSFDYKRAEVIIAFVNSLTLILIWIYIIYEAILRFFSDKIEVNSQIMFIVWFIWLLWNLVSIFFLHKEKEDNLNKKSAYLHLLYDSISSVLVVFWWILIYFTWFYIIDLIASIIISFFVIKSWYEILKKSLHILMQWVPEWLDIEKITSEIKNISWVKDVHFLHIWSIDSNEIFLSAHILTENQNDNLIKEINEFLHEKYEIHKTSLQLENRVCHK